MNIRDILRAKGHRVETVWPECALSGVLARFDERAISSVVVVDHASCPIGIVTDRDALQAITRHGPDALRLAAGRVMRQPAPSCTPADAVAAIMHRMTFDRIRHVVVMEGEQLVGIVSIGDLLKSRLADADLERRVLRDLALSLHAAQ